MKMVFFLAQILEFLLILYFAFLYVLRTGQRLVGIILTWVLLSGFTFIMVGINLEWVRASTVAGMAHHPLTDAGNMVNFFPEGPHLLMVLLLGWIPGVAIGELAQARREGPHQQQRDSIRSLRL